MSVSSVIVNYYTAHLLPPLLDNLLADPLISQIIIVDNSEDISPAADIPSFPQTEIRLISNKENIGFGKAVNQGLLHVKNDWFLIINPDVRLIEGCVRHLLDAARHYQTPLVGPRFFWDDNFIFRMPPAQGTCLWMEFACKSANSFEADTHLLSYYWTIRHDRFWSAKTPFFEPFLVGACFLAEKKWTDSMGGQLFDERFFLYYEDTDLCIRALSYGIRPICVPQAKAVHYYNQSPSSEKAILMNQSKELFFSKYYDSFSLQEFETFLPPPPFRDLGIVKHPPLFHERNCIPDEECYFEIGVNPLFVPFAQSVVTDRNSGIPIQIWEHMAPGTYFARIRGAVTGTRQIWKWEKSDSVR